MPPKQQSKADLAKKQKVVEDKTFGLKNKNKSKNVQKYVQNLKQSVQPKPDASKANAKVWFFLSVIPILLHMCVCVCVCVYIYCLYFCSLNWVLFGLWENGFVGKWVFENLSRGNKNSF